MKILGFALGYLLFTLFLTGMVRHGQRIQR